MVFITSDCDDDNCLSYRDKLSLISCYNIRMLCAMSGSGAVVSFDTSCSSINEAHHRFFSDPGLPLHPGEVAARDFSAGDGSLWNDET